jgi:hypothetical protein
MFSRTLAITYGQSRECWPSRFCLGNIFLGWTFLPAAADWKWRVFNELSLASRVPYK